MSVISSKTLIEFKQEFFCEFDPKGVPGQFSEDQFLRILCISDEPGPQSICYDVDWPSKYQECFKLREASQSRSVIDMMQQLLIREIHNLHKTMFSFRQDFNVATFEVPKHVDGTLASPIGLD